MPRLQNDALFELIKSLSKSEKRQLKIDHKPKSGEEAPLFIQLFDVLDKASSYDEKLIFTAIPDLKRQQLSNLKAHLYNHILENLRWLSRKKDVRLNIRQLIDYGQVLYNKGLYQQSLKILNKAKRLSEKHQEIVLKMQVLEFEKLIEGRHITRSIENRADKLKKESVACMQQLNNYSHFGNLALSLYGKYLELGHVRNEQEAAEIKQFFHKNLYSDGLSENDIAGDTAKLSIYERVNLYQAYAWYAYILQDFLLYYRYTQKWVNLFEEFPERKKEDPSLYIKAMHNLLTAHFFNRNYNKFYGDLEQLRSFYHKNKKGFNANTETLAFVYLYTAKINKHFLEGTFEEGLKLVPDLEQGLTDTQRPIDKHRILVFYYKIASLYFGSGDYNKTVSYLNQIINLKVGNLRSDIQCFARILHLIAHYELKNYDLTEYLLPSVYHFLEKNKEISEVLGEILKFLRRFNRVGLRGLPAAFSDLRERLIEVSKNPYERRFFLYLDVISWLESKIDRRPVQEIIQEKFVRKIPRI